MIAADIRHLIERTIHALALSTVRPTPGGGGGVSGGAVTPPMPLPDGVMEGKRLLHLLLADWARFIGEEKQIVIDADNDDLSLLAWISSEAEWLACHEAAPDFVEALTTAVRLIENPYLPQRGLTYMGDHGGDAVYVREGQSVVELADGRVERIETLRAMNADAMLLAEGTAKEVVEIIRTFFGFELTPRQVSNARDKDERRKSGEGLCSLRKEGRDHIYRVHDVMNRLVGVKGKAGIDI